MARPINADAEATRGRILAAARQLFSDRGSGSTSMRMIASEARVSVAMAHHYFGSKADLYHACVEGMYGELRELQTELEAAFKGASDLSAVLDMTVSAISHQLRVLRNMNLVTYRKDGKMVMYSLSNDNAVDIMRIVLEQARE